MGHGGASEPIQRRGTLLCDRIIAKISSSRKLSQRVVMRACRSMPLRKLLLAYIRSLMVKRELAIQRRGTLLCDRTLAKISS